MRFSLTLAVTSPNKLLPINYQYELHSWIYSVLRTADADYSRFLHDRGYLNGHHGFKLFTFSPLHIQPFHLHKQTQQIEILSERVTLLLSFWIDDAAEHFIKGLFADQEFRLGARLPGSRYAQVDFGVQCIEAMPRPVFTNTMRYRCVSPVMVTHRGDDERYARYLSPEAPGYGDYFIKNLVEKYGACVLPTPGRGELAHTYHRWSGFGGEIGGEWQEAAPVFALLNTPRKKGIHIKQHTPRHTQLIGYLYDFALMAPPALHELGYYAGFGEKNSLGFGCVEVVK